MGKISEAGGPSVAGSPEGLTIRQTDDETLAPHAVGPRHARPPVDVPPAGGISEQQGDDVASSDPGNVTHGVGGDATGDVPGDAPEGGNPPLPDPDLFDPSAHTVAEVQAYLEQLPDDDAGHAEHDRVLAAERADKARVTILSGE